MADFISDRKLQEGFTDLRSSRHSFSKGRRICDYDKLAFLIIYDLSYG